VQELDLYGDCKVVVLEALKCPSPDLNNGEDNAAFNNGKDIVSSTASCYWDNHILPRCAISVWEVV